MSFSICDTLNCDILTNVNTKELMQCQCGTDTSTMVDNQGLLEMRGETT